MRAKYMFSTKSGEIVATESDTNDSCQELLSQAARENPGEDVLEIFSEHVYPLPYLKLRKNEFT